MYKDEEGQSILHFTNLVFTKTGAEVIASVSVRIEESTKRSEEIRKEIEEIAKRREIDPQEVIEAGEDAAKISEYSNKMSNSLGATGAGKPQINISQNIIQALQNDITNIQSLGRRLARQKFLINDLVRIKNHVQPSESFELNFEELRSLGFR